MKILTINCGSSSIKFSFIDTTEEIVLADGIVEKIGEDIGLFTYKSEKYTKKKDFVEKKIFEYAAKIGEDEKKYRKEQDAYKEKIKWEKDAERKKKMEEKNPT